MRKILSLIVLFFIVSCGGGIEGYVGESITITAENPEEGKDVDYTWALANQPDGSLMNSADLFASDDGQKMTFIPDYPGDYSVEVSVSQYGDEISSQSFSFSISDPNGEEAEEEEEETEEIVDEEWLNEDMEEEQEVAYVDEEEDVDEEDEDEEADEDYDEEYEEIGVDEDEEIEENTAPVTKVTAPAPVKAIATQPKKGASIAARTDRYTIQITSKRMLKDAQLFTQKMIGKGFDAYIQKVVFNTDEIWYRVRVGSYDNYNSAKKAADALSGELGMATWVDFVRKEQ
jgi:septal ring-binding cell division protein DamX